MTYHKPFLRGAYTASDNALAKKRSGHARLHQVAIRGFRFYSKSVNFYVQVCDIVNLLSLQHFFRLTSPPSQKRYY